MTAAAPAPDPGPAPPAPLVPLVPCTRRYLTDRGRLLAPGAGWSLWWAGTLTGAATVTAAVITGPEQTDIRGAPVFPLTQVPAPLGPAVVRAEFVLTTVHHSAAANMVQVATFTQVTVCPAAQPAMVIGEVNNAAITWPLYPPSPLAAGTALPPEVQVYGLAGGAGARVIMSHFEESP